MDRYSRQMDQREYIHTGLGYAVLGDAISALRAMPPGSVDLVVTSPPFDLSLAKEYGNLKGDRYLDWIETIGEEVHRVLKPSGSFVLDLGGSWTKGLPVRNLYQFRVLLRLVDVVGFHLAQDFYWWNPSRLPTPAEWVTIRRIRVKDAVNTIWWLSKTPYPKAGNRRVLQEYSRAMEGLFRTGYSARKRPSGHRISETFHRNNGGAIPPNLLAVANTDSGSAYLRYCAENDLAPHPARFPLQIPEFFIRFLTNQQDLVVDPFAGSCATGAVAESLDRRWICIELEERYLRGARGRFAHDLVGTTSARGEPAAAYRVTRLGQYSVSADEAQKEELAADGGRNRATGPDKQ